MTFSPSRYQSAIFSFIDSGNGHAVVDAVPGSGKTTTLLEAARRLPKDAKAIFLAFNAHIAKELSEKLTAQGSSMTARTINSLGNAACTANGSRKLRLDEGKYREIAKSALLPYMHQLTPSNSSFKALCNQLRDLVNLARKTLTEPTESALAALINHYDLDISLADMSWPYLWQAVKPCMDEGKRLYSAGLIDFTDQVWLPVVLSLPCQRYEWVMVDEAQDLNKVQLELVLRSSSGRIIAVGDKRQSMYGFAGADTRSIDNIIERLHATVLPLSICYRCAPNIVRLAAQVYPGIEASNKPDGVIEVIKEDAFITTAKQGDLVLARMNAPLVSQCLRFLRAGVRAQVRGKDIGKGFSDLVKSFSMRMGYALENLGKLAEDYRREQINTYANVPDNELKIEQVNDKVDTFVALYEAYLLQAKGQGSIVGFMSYLEDFFTDDLGNGSKPVMFSTIHKAKGLEYDNVFILEPDKIPHPAAKKPWQCEQEYNIEYVAITRAIRSLRIVGKSIANLSIDDQQPKQGFIKVEGVQVSDLLGEYTASIGTEMQHAAEPVYDFSGIAKFAEAVNKHAILFENAKRAAYPAHKPAQEQDVCPACGAEADTSGICCWACGFKFDQQPAQSIMVKNIDTQAWDTLLATPESQAFLQELREEALQEFAAGKTLPENAAPKTSWVQPPKALVTQKVGRKPVDHNHGRKPKGKAPRVTLQLTIDQEVYERVMALKAAGEIESASALFEALFKARY